MLSLIFKNCTYVHDMHICYYFIFRFSNVKKIKKSTASTQAIGVYRGIILLLLPHPAPLPRERELAETLPQEDGVLKNPNQPRL